MASSVTQGRRLPRWSEVRPLLSNPGKRPSRLERAATVDDLRALARRRAPRGVFDYVDGGAESERSMARARAAYDAVTFQPRVLIDVSAVDTSTTILGRTAAMPLVLAPTGFSRMVHTDGEVGVARAASTHGVPYALSTMGTTGPERLAQEVPGCDRLFQLYVWRDRARSRDLLARAVAGGYHALVLTVDVPVAGARLRDLRGGFTIPPRLTARTVANIATRPRWWADALTSEPVSFASFTESPAALETVVNTMFDPAVTWDDVAWLRQEWPGQLVIKGIQRLADVDRAVTEGVDGLVLSNHGGRQLDRSGAPLDLLPRAVDRSAGAVELYVDGGVRCGADVAAAVALGATACWIGRPYLYGLMAGGSAGVARCLEIFAIDLHRTMQLLGARDVTELTTDLVGSAPLPEPHLVRSAAVPHHVEAVLD